MPVGHGAIAVLSRAKAGAGPLMFVGEMVGVISFSPMNCLARFWNWKNITVTGFCSTKRKRSFILNGATEPAWAFCSR
jgi:hypothetical protein